MQLPTSEPGTPPRIRRAVIGLIGTAVLVGGTLAGGEAAFAANDTTFSALASDFASPGDYIDLGADITNASGTLTLGDYTTGANSYSTLRLNGHHLTVQGIQLTSLSSGSPAGHTLVITGTGSVTVTQTSTSSPAIEVDTGSALRIYGGTITASIPSGSSTAVIGGGTAINGYQDSGEITFNGSPTVTASGATSGAAIGSGAGGSAGPITVGGSAVVTASATGGGAAIGDGSGVGGAAISVANDAQVTAHQLGTGNTGAGIGGGASPTGQTAGSVTVGDNAQVVATSAGKGAAIGGGYHGDGGAFTVTGYASVSATADASTGEAGIGDGDFATGAGTTVSIGNAASVTAVGGGAGGAGIGGGANAYGNGSVGISGTAIVSASGVNGPGIGGQKNRNSLGVTIGGSATVVATGGGRGAGIGGGDSYSPSFPSAGASVSIGSGAQVTVRAASGVSAVGGGDSTNFGSFSNAGTLTIPAGVLLEAPSGAAPSSSGTVLNSGVLRVTGSGSFSNSGLIQNSGSIDGSGTLVNSGSIRQDGAITATVTGNAFAVVYDAQGGSASTASQVVYADTVAAAGQSLASAVPPSAGAFVGWNTAADGTGSALGSTSSLTGLAGGASTGGLVTLRVYALYQLKPVLPSGITLAQAVVGSGYTSSVAATSGTAPITYAYTGDLPRGLSLNAGTGAVTGVPTTAGTFTMHLVASNAAGSTAHDYTIQVVPTLLTVGVAATAKGNARYLAGGTATVTLGGLQANEAYTVTIGGTRVYSGTAASNSAFTVRVTVPRSVKDGTQTVVLSGGGHVAAGSATILTAAVSKSLAVKVSAKKVKAGKRFTLTISKLYAKESVRVVIKGKYTTTATGTASAKGRYVLTVKKGLKKGTYTVTITGAGTSRTAHLKLKVR